MCAREKSRAEQISHGASPVCCVSSSCLFSRLSFLCSRFVCLLCAPPRCLLSCLWCMPGLVPPPARRIAASLCVAVCPGSRPLPLSPLHAQNHGSRHRNYHTGRQDKLPKEGTDGHRALHVRQQKRNRREREGEGGGGVEQNRSKGGRRAGDNRGSMRLTPSISSLRGVVCFCSSGTLTNGTKFDSSRDKGRPFQVRRRGGERARLCVCACCAGSSHSRLPLVSLSVSVSLSLPSVQFKLGLGQVIKGWDEGVAKLSKGERAKLTCSPDFAYVTTRAHTGGAQSLDPQRIVSGPALQRTVVCPAPCRSRMSHSCLCVCVCSVGLVWRWRCDSSERHPRLRRRTHLVPVN